MSKSIRTPYLDLRPHTIRQKFSEQLPYDDRLAQRVAQPLFDAGIIIAAITERRNYDSGLNPRPYHYLRLLLQGELQVQISGRQYDLDPGDLIFCPAGMPLRCSTGSTGAWYLYFQIEPRPEWEPLRKHGGYVRAFESTAVLFLLLRDTLDAMASPQPDVVRRARHNSRMLVELVRLEMAQGETKRSEEGSALHQLVEDVIAAPQKSWDRQGMAKRLHLSVSQVTRLFNQEFGVSPRTLVIRQRMQSATQELLNTNRKIETIASELGYESFHSFTRLFTRHVGIPPGQYRARYRHPTLSA
jgi:AraC-like DNA-binding protein